MFKHTSGEQRTDLKSLMTLFGVYKAEICFYSNMIYSRTVRDSLIGNDVFALQFLSNNIKQLNKLSKNSCY